MKIKSNLKNNFWKIYSESRFVAIHRKSIMRRGKVTKANYLEETVLLYSIIVMFATIIMLLKLNSIYAYILIVAGIIYILFNVIRIYEDYKLKKEKNFENTIVIDQRGITDPSSFNRVESTFKWDEIKNVVITKNTVVILTDKKVYFYFDIKQKSKITKEIKKYKKDIQIIEN